MNASQLSRRSFFNRISGAAFGLPIFSTLTDLRLINSAVAQDSFSDYKALVCVFLGGGNDQCNFIAPMSGDAYTEYAAMRPGLALSNDPGSGLAYTRQLNLTNNPYGYNFGIHSSAPELQNLFNTGKMAVMANVGSLVEPLTRSEYIAKTKKKPPQLFSHNDQVAQWQTSIPDQLSRTGWGGRVADLLTSSNSNPQISMSISLAGANTWEVGDVVQTYQVLPAASGDIASSLKHSSGDSPSRVTARMDAINNIIGNKTNNFQNRTNMTEKDYAALTRRALDAASALNLAITSADSGTGSAIPLASFATFANNSLSNQLKSIARIINARDLMGFKRQIFFCSVGGYDTHNGQLSSHPGLLATLSSAMHAFYQTTVNMGIADKVTAFTSSDFGRTMKFNGSGSDHAWGTHQIIVGDAVQGQKFFGAFPNLAMGGPDDGHSDGRYIPTTSVDQYSATLAKWFGVTEGNLDTVFPNLNRFATRDVGFLG